MTGVTSFEELMLEFWRVWAAEGVAGLLARHRDFFTEDGVWSPPIAQISGHDYVGRAGFAEYVNDFHDTFKSFAGEVRAGTAEEVTADLWRSEVRVSAEMRDGGNLDANLIAIVRMRDGRMAYGWGTYDPAAAERKLAELLGTAEEAAK